MSSHINMNDCVYVIQANNGEVKVGLSGTPYARLSHVKRDYGKRRGFTDAYLVGFVTTNYGMQVESLADKFISNYAVGGEWYNVNPFTALQAVIKAAQYFQRNVVVETIGPNIKKPSVKALRKLIKQSVPGYNK